MREIARNSSPELPNLFVNGRVLAASELPIHR